MASAKIRARLKALRRKHHLGEFSTKSHKKNKTRSVKTMGRKHHSRRGSSSKGMTPMQALIGGFVYGVARKPINDIVKGAIPGGLGNVSDEIIMGVVDFLAASKGSGIIKDAGKVGLGIEAARMAGNFNIGLTGSTTSSTSSTGATF